MARSLSTTRAARFGTSPALLGVDVGGTNTRAVLAHSDGTVVGRGRGPGANRHSSAAALRAVLVEAVESAIAATDGALSGRDVCAAVVAVAGLSHADAVQPEIEAALAETDVRVPPTVVPDVVANHAAGRHEADGFVLAAGTGAIGAGIIGHRVVRRADGAGWLLGDDGSAVWFGLEAVRAVLRGWDGRGPTTALATPVTAELLGAEVPGSAEATSAVIAAVGARSPASLGILARPVITLAAEDAVAAAILSRATDGLESTVVAAVGDETPSHLVLAGSVLLGAPELRDALLERLRMRWPSLAVVAGRDGAGGAAAIALWTRDPSSLTPTAHQRLVGSSVSW